VANAENDRRLVRSGRLECSSSEYKETRDVSRVVFDEFRDAGKVEEFRGELTGDGGDMRFFGGGLGCGTGAGY
jgi:hypothetical protein